MLLSSAVSTSRNNSWSFPALLPFDDTSGPFSFIPTYSIFPTTTRSVCRDRPPRKNTTKALFKFEFWTTGPMSPRHVSLANEQLILDIGQVVRNRLGKDGEGCAWGRLPAFFAVYQTLTLYRCAASRRNSSSSYRSSRLAKLMLLKLSKLSIKSRRVL